MHNAVMQAAGYIRQAMPEMQFLDAPALDGEA
jgi:hypothetical protein